MDPVTWSALGLILTLLGLGWSYVAFKRDGAGRGLRLASLSLLPLAAGLTGTLRLFGDILEATTRWATRLVFSPMVWSGLVVLALAVVLFGISSLMSRDKAPSARQVRRDRTAGAKAGGTPAVSSRKSQASGNSTAGSTSGGEAGEFDEIEAILRKHGIS